jgi:hypothetical protein
MGLPVWRVPGPGDEQNRGAGGSTAASLTGGTTSSTGSGAPLSPSTAPGGTDVDSINWVSSRPPIPTERVLNDLSPEQLIGLLQNCPPQSPLRAGLMSIIHQSRGSIPTRPYSRTLRHWSSLRESHPSQRSQISRPPQTSQRSHWPQRSQRSRTGSGRGDAASTNRDVSEVSRLSAPSSFPFLLESQTRGNTPEVTRALGFMLNGLRRRLLDCFDRRDTVFEGPPSQIAYYLSRGAAPQAGVTVAQGQGESNRTHILVTVPTRSPFNCQALLSESAPLSEVLYTWGIAAAVLIVQEGDVQPIREFWYESWRRRAGRNGTLNPQMIAQQVRDITSPWAENGFITTAIEFRNSARGHAPYFDHREM